MSTKSNHAVFIAVLGLTMVAATQLAAAEVWKGKWVMAGGGGGDSTLEFLAGSQVKYCFNSSCSVQAYSGSENGTVKFSWGEGRYSFKWNGHGYNGTYNGTQGASPVAVHATVVMK